MKSLVVKQGTVTSAGGKVLSGWLVFEDGKPGYPFPTKEGAVKQARGIKAIRCAPHVTVEVID